MNRLALDLDDVAKDDQGVLANRPVSTGGSPGKFGRYYWATDTLELYRDFGTGWTKVYPNVPMLPVNYLYSGQIFVPAGDTDFMPPFYVGARGSDVLSLVGIRGRLNSGTSATFKVQKNGSDVVTGCVALSSGDTNFTVPTGPFLTFAHGDRVNVVVTSVSATPKHLSITFFFQGL
jgi:hypothetical protein